MPYVGRGTDKLSNVEVLDNITFDGSSSYTLQKGGSNFTPSSANTLLLSIDGVVQAGNFTVSGSTIDFGTAVAGTSTCDFILHYGIGLITTPSDGTVTTAKLADSSVSTAKLQDSSVTTSKLNDASVSLAKLTATGTKDATTFLRGDNTFAEAGGGKVLQVVTATNSTASDTTSTSFTSSGLEASITPSSTSNKILVITSNSVEAAGTSGFSSYFSIYRDSTNLGDSSVGFGVIYSGISIVNPTILDSPSTTSSVTYKFMGRTQSASTTTYFQRYNALGTITLLEIAG